MNNPEQPWNKFDRFLKAMVQGEPPKSAKQKAEGREMSEKERQPKA